MQLIHFKHQHILLYIVIMMMVMMILVMKMVMMIVMMMLKMMIMALTKLKYYLMSLCAFLYINLFYNNYIHYKAIWPLWVGFNIHYADAIAIGDYLMQ